MPFLELNLVPGDTRMNMASVRNRQTLWTVIVNNLNYSAYILFSNSIKRICWTIRILALEYCHEDET